MIAAAFITSLLMSIPNVLASALPPVSIGCLVPSSACTAIGCVQRYCSSPPTYRGLSLPASCSVYTHRSSSPAYLPNREKPARASSYLPSSQAESGSWLRSNTPVPLDQTPVQGRLESAQSPANPASRPTC